MVQHNVQNSDIIKLVKQGLSERKIAKKLVCSRSCIWARKKNLGLKR